VRCYADSSFLVSLYFEDANSARASHLMIRLAEPLPFNPLHRLEVRNAGRLAVKRREISPEGRKAGFALIEEDLRAGILVHEPIAWADALRRAETLSAKHTERTGSRAADILHIAIALEAGADRFLTFDVDQAALAKAEGLKVRP